MKLKWRRHLFTLGAGAVVLTLAVLLSPWAATAPDGLERIAHELGLITGDATSPVWENSPAAEYRVPGVADERTSTRLAGLLGIVVAFGGGALLGRLLMRRHRQGTRPTAEGTELLDSKS